MNLDGILNFMLNNYIYFVIVAIIFVLTLIGYFVDEFRQKSIRKQIEREKIDNENSISIANFNPNKGITEQINLSEINSKKLESDNKNSAVKLNDNTNEKSM
jgi:hypothetical protein